jgi:ribosome-binding factor A
MGVRQERLADEIRDLLAMCFQGGALTDPRLEAVTITAVKLSPDLQLASVYFRLYEGADAEQAARGLEAASGYLRRQLADSLTVRRVPNLRFFLDESIERASRVEDILRKL